MSWTDERVELLKQLWLDGRSASQISAALGNGLTRNAVIGKVHRLGLAGRPRSSAPASAGMRTPRVRSSIQRAPAARAAPRARMIHGNNALAYAHDYQIDDRPSVHEDVVLPMSLKVTIIDLKEAMCKWPLGDPTSPDFRYCGANAPGGPYCSFHAKLAYQPAQDRRRDRDRRAR
jgi:GcrA cell cycle regulator